jgi:hypothetical protein
VREERLQNGDFSFDAAEDGIYRYCFSNVSRLPPDIAFAHFYFSGPDRVDGFCYE